MFQIIAILFLFSSAFADVNNTAIVARKISKGWEYCGRYHTLSVRCNSDCDGLEYCMNGNVHRVSCLQQTGMKYCDQETHSCSDNIDVCYNSKDFCPTDGIYPDLTNCQRYVYCDGEAMHPYQCEHGTKWNYRTGNCEDNVDCITYTRDTGCGGPAGNSLVPHMNPRWFVFCNWGRALLAECPGTSYTFDPNLGNCRFQCEHQENVCQNAKYPDERDPSTYYDCYKVRNKWVTMQKKCPKGTTFDEYSKVCKRNEGETNPSTNTRIYEDTTYAYEEQMFNGTDGPSGRGDSNETNAA